MRKITVEYQLYNYNELDEKVKEKVKNEISENIIEDRFYFLKDDLLEYLNYNHNISDCELDYSFSYCQGDGCCFYDINLLNYFNIKNKKNLNSFEKNIIEKYTDEEINLILQYLNDGYNIYIKKNGYHYSHKYTCYIDFEFYYDDNKELENKINELIEKLADDLQKNIYYKICDEMEKIGYDCYNVIDEEIENYINDYGLEFYKNGDFYYNY